MKHVGRIAIRGCAALAVALTAATAVAQEVSFAYRFEPGTAERYRVKLNQEVEMGSIAVGNLADMEVSLKCVSGAEGKYAMQMTFDKVDVSSSMMGTVTPSPLGEQLMGQSITFDVDASGDVSHIKPVGTFEAWDTAKQLVEPVVDSWYVYLPSKPVAVGGTWKKDGEKETQSSGTETVTNASYAFKAMRKEKGRDVAVLEQLLDTDIGGMTATPMGTFAVAGGGKGKFEILFDPAKSRVVKLKGKVDLAMDMTPQAAGGDVVKTVVTNHVERDLLD